MDLDLDLAESVVKQAIAGGADEAEVYFTQSYDSSVRLRKQKVELLKEAQPRSMSLRLYQGKRAAVVYTSDFGKEALTKLVEQALDLATISDADPAAGLPDAADLYQAFEQDLAMWDGAVGDIPTEIKVNYLKRCEDAAYGYDPRVNNSEGSSFRTRTSQVGLVNSLGFAGSYRYSFCSMSMDALVDDSEGKKQNGWWFTNGYNFKGLQSPEEVGRIAAKHAVHKIGSRKVATRRVPVVWDAPAASDFLGALTGTISGDALERRASFLMGSEGKKIGSDWVTIVDDPLKPGLLGTRPFDGEGVTSRKNKVFTNGVFEGFLFNAYTARKTGQRTTGNAQASIGSLPGVGVTNFYIEPGTTKQADMIKSVKDGLFLTEMIGFGFNPVTGDISRGAVGMWIENGELTYPVSEINIAGNMRDILASVVQVGDDVLPQFETCSPSLLTENIAVSGL